MLDLENSLDIESRKYNAIGDIWEGKGQAGQGELGWTPVWASFGATLAAALSPAPSLLHSPLPLSLHF